MEGRQACCSAGTVQTVAPWGKGVRQGSTPPTYTFQVLLLQQCQWASVNSMALCD